MRKYQKIIITLIMILTIVFQVGCEYDVAEPMWEQPYENLPIPRITQINPVICTAGVNYITIYGENFAPELEENEVYFNGSLGEMIEGDSTYIRLRRPNITGDSVNVHVVPIKFKYTDVVAKYSPYQIDPVMEQFGGFMDNEILSAIAVDSEENLYVFVQEDLSVYKVTSNGIKQSLPLGESPGQVTDVKVSPQGTLLMMTGESVITQMDSVDGEVTPWASVNMDVALNCGDFDSYGNFYTAGDESGLFIIRDGETVGDSLIVSFYQQNSCQILDMKVYGDYLYFLADCPRRADMEDGFYRHEILGSDGTLGELELIIEVSTAEIFDDAVPSTFAISTDGIVYFGTNDENNPVRSYNIDDGTWDILYKNIIPSISTMLEWGEGNYLYMIHYSTDTRDLLRIDMGAAGATYYGRH